MLTAGDAPSLGSLPAGVAHRPIVDIDVTPSGRGYWLTSDDGGVFTIGDAPFHGALPWSVPRVVTAMTPTPDGRGYWLVGPTGGIVAFGSAPTLGNGAWRVPPYPYNLFRPAPGPAVAIVRAPGRVPGYWIVDDNGRVVARGAAADLGGDSNLALLTL